MSARTVYWTGLIVALLQAGSGAAQQPPAQAPMPTPVPPAPAPMPTLVPGAALDPSVPAYGHAPGLSPYVTYSHGDCCGPIGKHGPIWMEVYVRTGASFPVSGGMLADRLDAGWFIQGGGRSLFFDADELRAWTIDLSISNDSMSRKPGSLPFVAINPVTGTADTVRARNFDRTYVNAVIGREYYIVGSASSPSWCWRAGGDVGLRWGSARLDVDDPVVLPSGFQRHNSWSWGQVGALHTDIEVPLGCAFWVLGGRLEFDATYQRRLTGNGSSNQVNDINVLVTSGILY